MTDIFDKHFRKYDSWYDQNRPVFLSELKAVKKVLPRKGLGLEIGVGSGRFASGLNIGYGIDLSGNLLKIARQRGVKTIRGRAEKLPFKNANFDYAAVLTTICFLKDPLKALREAGRVLKKRGKLIIGLVDRESFLAKFYQKKKSVFYKQANFYSVHEVKSLLAKAGFQQFAVYQTLFNLPGEITFPQKPRKGHGRGGFVVISGRKKG